MKYLLDQKQHMVSTKLLKLILIFIFGINFRNDEFNEIEFIK